MSHFPFTTNVPLEHDRDSLRAQAFLVTPPGAKILVVSKGDDALLELDGRVAGHFPQTESGVYSGHHPADSAEAIARLDDLRARGAAYLLFPSTSFWWLDHYTDFAQHLENIGSLVQRNDRCLIYCLRRLALPSAARAARVVALLAVHNEGRFIANCLEHLIRQGVHVLLLDNDSTDQTVALAQRFLGRGLLGIERLPRAGDFNLRDQLVRKEQQAAALDADWIMHVDADEMPVAPVAGLNLAEALAAVAAAGYDVVNFQEFTFIPTAEAPDHDHPDFARTMRWYYPFLPYCPWGLRAWRRQARVELAPSGGHQLRFPDMRLCPLFFRLKHYQFLSVAQAGRKYARRYAAAELNDGLHGGHRGWRALFRATDFRLPSARALREFAGDEQLDARSPRRTHFLDEMVQALVQETAP